MISLFNSSNPAGEIPHHSGFMSRLSTIGNDILYGIFARFVPPPTTALEIMLRGMTPEERAAWDAEEPRRRQRQEEVRLAQEADTRRKFIEFLESYQEEERLRARTYAENLTFVKEQMGMTPESAKDGGRYFQRRLEAKDPWYLEMQRWNLDPRWEDPEFRKIQAQRYMNQEFDIPNTYLGNMTQEGNAAARFCSKEIYDISIKRTIETNRQMREMLSQIQRNSSGDHYYQEEHRRRFEEQSTWERTKTTMTVVASSRIVQVTAALGVASLVFFWESKR